MSLDHSSSEKSAPPNRGPAEVFRFCPACGAAEPNRSENHRTLRCPMCGLLYFFNPAAAAGVFIFHNDRLILCVRAKPPALGKLDLPGGFIDFDESVETGLRREIREELNLEVTDFQYLCSAPNDYRYAGVPYKTTDLFFICEAPDLASIRPADDVADYRVLALGEIDVDGLAFQSTRQAFQILRRRQPAVRVPRPG